MTLAAHGLSIELPSGWSGRVFRRAGGNATLHAGDFPLALHDGEFGDASTAAMPVAGSFLALAEYVPGAGLEPGKGLFAPQRILLPLDPARFAANRLAHPRRRQAGTQQFFTRSERPFCLYLVVAGGLAHRRRQLAGLDRVLGTIGIAPAGSGLPT